LYSGDGILPNKLDLAVRYLKRPCCLSVGRFAIFRGDMNANIVATHHLRFYKARHGWTNFPIPQQHRQTYLRKTNYHVKLKTSWRRLFRFQNVFEHDRRSATCISRFTFFSSFLRALFLVQPPLSCFCNNSHQELSF
jgi:hypothetical protein